MKDISDHILVVHQKSLCQRNKEIASFEMNSYRAVEKAAKGTYTSWMLAIMVAVTKVLRQAQSKEVFCNLLQNSGIKVDWQENRKYVVFSDKEGNKEKKWNKQQ